MYNKKKKYNGGLRKANEKERLTDRVGVSVCSSMILVKEKYHCVEKMHTNVTVFFVYDRSCEPIRSKTLLQFLN